MASATVTSKGQITLPKEIRETLGVHAGDRVVFWRDHDGRMVIEPETVDLLGLKGLLKPERRDVTVEDMDAAIRNAGTRR